MTLPTLERTIAPHRAKDDDWSPLFAFACRAVDRIARVVVATKPFSDATESEPWVHTTRTLRFGDDARGIAIVLRREEVEMGVISTSAHRLRVTTYGLPDDRALELESVRPPNTPDFLRTLTARIRAPETDATPLLDELTTHRAHDLTRDERAGLLLTARHHLRPYAWDAAAAYARFALETEPDDVEAQFVLGVALGAKGELAPATDALRAVVARRPDHHDAWYNLGLARVAANDHAEAARCFESSLRASPDNAPVLYQLGCAREALGDSARALEAYRAAVARSPNPGGVWHYTGLDFTESARAAIERLTKSATTEGIAPSQSDEPKAAR